MGRTARTLPIPSEGPGSSDNQPRTQTWHSSPPRRPRSTRPFPECCPRRDQVAAHNRRTREACATGVTSPRLVVPNLDVCESGLWTLRGARVSKVIEELQALNLAQELFPHAALVRHIQFSSNGSDVKVGVYVLHPCGCDLTDQLCLDCNDFSASSGLTFVQYVVHCFISRFGARLIPSHVVRRRD